MSLNEEAIKTLTKLLEEKRIKERKEEQGEKYEKVKDVLIFLGFFGACLLAPKAGTELLTPLIKRPEYNSWKKLNKSYLKWTIKRLANQKMVEIKSDGEEQIVTITDNGKKKILKYAMEDLDISKPKSWDGKWRIVMYDIKEKNRRLAQLIRETLTRLGFIVFQESVYLFPYPCDREIEYLRSYYNLSSEIKYIVANHIEDEEVYKDYFDLK